LQRVFKDYRHGVKQGCTLTCEHSRKAQMSLAAVGNAAASTVSGWAFVRSEIRVRWINDGSNQSYRLKEKRKTMNGSIE